MTGIMREMSKELLNTTVRDLQIAKQELSRVVNNGDFHTLLDSRVENPIHLIPGIDQICELSLTEYYAPLNVLFTYENQGDWKVMLNQKHIEPNFTNNEGVYLNPKKIYVDGMKGSQQFGNKFLYLAFTSLMGVNFKVQASFYDANTAINKKLKNSDSNLEQTTNRKGFEMKIKQEISRCLADPSVYKEMMANMTEL